jgi:hypothetical protein
MWPSTGTAVAAGCSSSAGQTSEEKDFSRSYVSSCAASSFFVYKLVAAQNHEQLCQPFLVLVGEPDNPPPKRIERNLVARDRSLEFNADDGQLITVRW